MDFFEVVETRQSIRAFQDKPIEPEKLQQILETINRAPSAGNVQGYEVYLVTKRTVLESLARATSGQDAAIACAYAQLAVTALGLATVWVGAFDEEAVRAAIGVGHDLRPVSFLPIGYAAEAPEHRSRRVLTELVHRIE
jgi:nitroreductase